jgi:hypothetical protein
MPGLLLTNMPSRLNMQIFDLVASQVALLSEVVKQRQLDNPDVHKHLNISLMEWMLWMSFAKGVGPIPQRPALSDLLLRLAHLTWTLSGSSDARHQIDSER